MSWKGLIKAAKRLPHQIRTRSGHAETTIDYEYEDMESAFKTLEMAAKKLNDDAKRFRDALGALLNHQMEFGTILGDVYVPVSGRRDRTGEDANSPIVGGHGLTRAVTPPQSLKAVQDFSRAMQTVKEELAPELESITRRVVQPTADYITLIDQVKKMIIKRAHKLVDYDRHRLALKSLKNKPEKTLSDEKEVTKKQVILDQATREYEHINNLLKQELPVFLDLRVQFIDPCFMTLYWYQLKVYTVITQHLYGLVHENYDGKITASLLAEQAHQRCIALLSQVSLVRTVAGKEQPAYNYSSESGNESDNNSAGRSSNDFTSPPPYGYGSDSNNNSSNTYPSSPNASSFNIPRQSSTSPTKHSYPVTTATSAATSPPSKTYGSPSREYASPARSSHPTATIRPPQPPQPPQNTTKHVVAIYDFDGQQEGDLVFRKGDQIQLIERTDNVNDWWIGELRGVEGQFPGNYVEDV
ncbi:hypothetical protein SeMB42_g00496 [Synchytrium endobioticum]|uniref:BAR domain-containing protein n=1 Tax=Synchytrium endobioticum TaxID=286115 RepID=A0A507DQG3_9FUNG|nr:hypothetical protein SeMB42_g00496 [Synchytrium endobioticum]